MKAWVHMLHPGVYGTTDSGLTYRLTGATWRFMGDDVVATSMVAPKWEPCIIIPPDNEFRREITATNMLPKLP